MLVEKARGVDDPLASILEDSREERTAQGSQITSWPLSKRSTCYVRLLKKYNVGVCISC